MGNLTTYQEEEVNKILKGKRSNIKRLLEMVEKDLLLCYERLAKIRKIMEE